MGHHCSPFRHSTRLPTLKLLINPSIIWYHSGETPAWLPPSFSQPQRPQGGFQVQHHQTQTKPKCPPNPWPWSLGPISAQANQRKRLKEQYQYLPRSQFILLKTTSPKKSTFFPGGIIGSLDFEVSRWSWRGSRKDGMPFSSLRNQLYARFIFNENPRLLISWLFSWTLYCATL